MIKLWQLTSICEGQVPSQAELSEDQEKREQLGVGHAEEVPAAVGQHRLEARQLHRRPSRQEGGQGDRVKGRQGGADSCG